MSKRTKIWLIVAACLVLLGGVLFAVAMSFYHWDFTELSTEKYETNTFHISDEFEGISINTNTADISFAPSDDGNSKVVCYETDKERHLVLVKDNILTIQLNDEREWYEHIGIYVGSPKITIYLPEAEYNSLDIKSSTGTVKMPQNFQFEKVEIALTTGDVTFAASTSDFAKIKTTTGDVKVENITVGMLDLSVSTGSVVVCGVTCEGDVKINVTTGKTTLTDVACKNLMTKGTTGNFSLSNTVATEQFSIERSTGDVKFENSDATEIFIVTSTGDVKGSLRTDKVFITETDTGRVQVPKSVNGGRCEITTDTGDIIIEIQYTAFVSC